MSTSSSTMLVRYTAGFLLSLLTTGASFLAAFQFTSVAPIAIALFAVFQFGIQLAFFIHMGEERFSSALLWFTGIVIGILVIGTLWIMVNLTRLHPHSPTEMDMYEDGIVSPAHERK